MTCGGDGKMDLAGEAQASASVRAVTAETGWVQRGAPSRILWENASQGEHMKPSAGVGGLQGGGKMKGWISVSELKNRQINEGNWGHVGAMWVLRGWRGA